MNALESGHSVGRYRIVKFLGAGAMGEVYLAEDPQIDRRLAIKTVRLVGRPQEIEDRKRRLLREARAAGRLLHPNVVTLFDAGEAEERKNAHLPAAGRIHTHPHAVHPRQQRQVGQVRVTFGAHERKRQAR